MARAPAGIFRQGMSVTEREAAREKLADWYAEHGLDEERELRRQHMSPACGGFRPEHSLCRAEDAGGAGCICSHHDEPPGALVPSRTPPRGPALAMAAAG